MNNVFKKKDLFGAIVWFGPWEIFFIIIKPGHDSEILSFKPA